MFPKQCRIAESPRHSSFALWWPRTFHKRPTSWRPTARSQQKEETVGEPSRVMFCRCQKLFVGPTWWHLCRPYSVAFDGSGMFGGHSWWIQGGQTPALIIPNPPWPCRSRPKRHVWDRPCAPKAAGQRPQNAACDVLKTNFAGKLHQKPMSWGRFPVLHRPFFALLSSKTPRFENRHNSHCFEESESHITYMILHVKTEILGPSPREIAYLCHRWGTCSVCPHERSNIAAPRPLAPVTASKCPSLLWRIFLLLLMLTGLGFEQPKEISWVSLEIISCQ